MGFPGIRKTQGKDFNYYAESNVNWSTFGGGTSDGYGPDLIITFVTQGVLFLNQGSGTVEYSFNGTTKHGELNSGGLTQSLSFDNRIISLIWFRLKAGSAGPINIAVQAWSIP